MRMDGTNENRTSTAAELLGAGELYAAIEAFNKANEDVPVYHVDYSTAVVLDELVLAEWRK